MEALLQDEYYTYSDYKEWNTKDRYEIIDGIAYAMAPPSIAHQNVSSNLHREIANFLKDKPCKVYAAPVGVRLNADKGDNTVLEPDIVVVCDKSKIGRKSIIGAPDMVIEILSPSTVSRDRVAKFNQYLQAKVREYWIADPDSKTVSVHLLENEKYTASAYGETDKVSVHVLDGCVIDLVDVFTDIADGLEIDD